MKLPPGYVAGVGVHKATAFGGLGQRLMEQMGWQKGQGLGKDKSGMKEAIEVKEKKDVLGVGADASWNWDRKYWDDAYNSAIQNINHLAKDPWGRWGGRAGKMARIRAQEQEEANRARAKLGLPPLPAAPFATFKPTPAEGWWGAKMFVSVGLMESLEDEAEREARMQATAAKQDADAAAGVVALRGAAAVAAGQRKGFCEDDQEALYKRAHDFQRVGRRGLGKAEIKVGAKWEGTKKTFGEENDQEGGDPAEGGKQQLGDDEEEAQEQPHNEGAAAGKKKGKKDKKQDKEGKGSGRKAKAEADAEDGGEVKKSKRQKTAAAAAEADETPGSTVAATSAEAAEGANGGAAPPPKWLKLAKTVLKKSAERRMKLRKVVEELKDKKDKKSKKAGAEAGAEDAAAGATAGSPWCENSVREVLERKIRKSNSGLALDGKYVTLVAAGDPHRGLYCGTADQATR
eukprot:XP_001690268.1 predicted protein [Chlamydomonas reinhardtii]